MMMVFKNHHKSPQVRVLVLNTFGGSPGSDGAEIKGYVDEWHDVGKQQGEALAATITNTLKVHILVDLAGHTFGHRLSALALRPAPISMTYLGYASTTGADFVDYMVSDRVVSGPEMAGHYSESLALMPSTFYPLNTRQPVAGAFHTGTRKEMGLPPIRATAGGGSGSFVWACFNRNLKIKPDIWKVWMQLLRDHPESVLWLRRFHIRVQDNLKKHALAANVSVTRLVFAGRMPDRAQHISRHRHADLFLDTPRYGGHSTLADVVWAAVPSIVIAGENMASRIGASLMLAVGAGAFVARHLEDYGHIATACAPTANHKALLHYRNRINTTLHEAHGPLASGAYTKRLEGMYRLAWETFRARRQAENPPLVIGSKKLDKKLDKVRAKAPALIYTGHAVLAAEQSPGMEILEDD